MFGKDVHLLEMNHSALDLFLYSLNESSDSLVRLLECS